MFSQTIDHSHNFRPFRASLLLNPDSRVSFCSTNVITLSGNVLAYCLSAQPIAFRTKNSVLSIRSRIMSCISLPIRIFPVSKLVNNSLCVCSQKFSPLIHLRAKVGCKSGYRLKWIPTILFTPSTVSHQEFFRIRYSRKTNVILGLFSNILFTNKQGDIVHFSFLLLV